MLTDAESGRSVPGGRKQAWPSRAALVTGGTRGSARRSAHQLLVSQGASVAAGYSGDTDRARRSWATSHRSSVRPGLPCTGATWPARGLPAGRAGG